MSSLTENGNINGVLVYCVVVVVVEPELICLFSPAVFVECHDEAFVLNAGHRGKVPVLAGEHLVPAVPWLSADVSVLRTVEPQQ